MYSVILWTTGLYIEYNNLYYPNHSHNAIVLCVVMRLATWESDSLLYTNQVDCLVNDNLLCVECLSGRNHTIARFQEDNKFHGPKLKAIESISLVVVMAILRQTNY